MNISLMNTKISIQKNTVVVDEIGNRTNEWTDFYSCFATVSGEIGKETETARTTAENYSLSFTIRYCRKINDISSTDYRIIINDEIFNILNVDHLGYRNKAMKLKCQKVRK